jgi:acetylornithine deacetylase/succinyl-diaminopimelate desuccinylase-like protein
LIYGHYDVQPPEPLEVWKSAPFQPTIRNCSIYARGASDNKGQHFAHLKAVEAYLQTGTELPCDLTFVIEGEEEVGSKNFATFLKHHRHRLHCEGVVISDTCIPSLRYPALVYALRGLVALEIKLVGPNRDLHSGIYGGAVDNPAMALSQMMGQLRDKNGRVRIPGFYADVIALSALERTELARLPFNAISYQKGIGVRRLFGEPGYSVTERTTARPTLEINGLTSGYQGAGMRTIIPSWAAAKITLRLVPNQNAEKVLALVKRHLRSICPPTLRLEIADGNGGDPYHLQPDCPLAQAALRALETSFKHRPFLTREGVSIPVVSSFKRFLGADSLLLGLALPDDNPHGPNEKLSLHALAVGYRMSALLWQELGRLCNEKA